TSKRCGPPCARRRRADGPLIAALAWPDNTGRAGEAHPMTTTGVAWPRKTRDIHNHHMDSTVWDRFKFRDDDVIVATYGKSGTTWPQHIVGQLLFHGAPPIEISNISPWLDLRIMPPEIMDMVEAQTHRRVIKTHLPLDALVFSPEAKYLYVARDGRDVLWSLY